MDHIISGEAQLVVVVWCGPAPPCPRQTVSATGLFVMLHTLLYICVQSVSRTTLGSGRADFLSEDFP